MKIRFEKNLVLAILLVCSVSTLFADSDAAVFRVPKVEGLTVDGVGSDWGSEGFRVEILTAPDGEALPAEDFDVRFRLAWDEQGLYVLAAVDDDVGVEHESLSRLWRCDCLELSIAQDVAHSNKFMLVIAPGADPKYGKLRTWVYDWRPKEERLASLAYDTASRKVEGGYVVEIMLPWRNLRIQPTVGSKIALQIIANDDDGQGQSFRVSWFPEISPADSAKMYGLELSGDSSEPIVFRVDREIDESQYALSVQAAGGMTGKEVIARCGERIVAKQRLSDDTGRPHAVFSWSKEGDADTWPPVRLEVSGKTLAEYEEIPTIDRIVRKYIRAVGGNDAFSGLATRSAQGRYFSRRGDTVFQLEAFSALPDKWTIRIENSAMAEKHGYDGTVGWTQGADRLNRADHLARSILGWWLNPRGPVLLSRYFPRLRLIKEDDREGNTIFVMESAPHNGTKHTLEFDARTGLLWRIDDNVMLEDYQRVEDLYFPHRVVIGEKDRAVEFVLEEIKQNVIVGDGEFAMPDAGDVFPDAFQGISPVTGVQSEGGGRVRYFAGKFRKYKDASVALSMIREKGYTDAFVVAWYNGNIVSTQRAKELE